MKRIWWVVAAVIVGTPLVLSANAQDKDKKKDDKKDNPFAIYVEFGQPVSEHKVFEPMVGKWKVNGKMWMDGDPKQEMPITGSGEYKLLMGGRFLHGEFKGGDKEMEFHGIGYYGYDRAKKAYTSVWIENMSTSIGSMEGTYDAGKKTFTWKGEMYDVKRKKNIKGRELLTLDSKDKMSSVLYQELDGKEVKTMEMTFERAK